MRKCPKYWKKKIMYQSQIWQVESDLFFFFFQMHKMLETVVG